jgi:hypothetical protein
VRRGVHEALLALGERDQPGAPQELAGLLRPLLVLAAHAFGIGRVDLVQLVKERDPVLVAGYLLRQPAQLRGEEVVLLAAALAQLARVVREQLLFAEERGVHGLSDRVPPGRLLLEVLQVRGEPVERLRRRRAGRRELLAGRRVLHLARHEFARIPARGFRLADGALDVDRWRERGVEVRDAVLDRGRHLLEARARRIGQLALGPDAVQEEHEDALQAGVEIRRRLALPHLVRMEDLAPAEDRDQEVAIDGRGPETLVRDGAETRQPLEVALLAPLERRRRDVIELLVIRGQAERARVHRRVLVLLFQETHREVREGAPVRRRGTFFAGPTRPRTRRPFPPMLGRHRILHRPVARMGTA